MRKILLLLAILVGFATLSAQNSEYKKGVFTVGKDSLQYRYLTPKDISPRETYPLIIFLHGSGERGTDNEKQLVWGSQMFLNPVNRDKHKAFVIFPQCPEDKYWSYDYRPAPFNPLDMPIMKEPTTLVKLIRGLIIEQLKDNPVDPSRIYIMGVSMGAMATYDIVSRYPSMFAAAVPICGAINPEALKTDSEVTWFIYHGDADDVVPVECSRKAYEVLNKKYDCKVNYTEIVGCGHVSWNAAFNQPNFMKDLFRCSRKTPFHYGLGN